MKSHSPPDLTALLGSRICHDLISPLGAIGNGLELLEMAGGTEGPEMALMADSVKNANARIRFFRIAFGAASPAQRIAGSELGAVLDDSYDGGRLTVHHDLAPDLPRAEAKLALLVVQCLETALPLGGEIVIQGATSWSFQATGPRLTPDSALWEAIASPSPPPDLAAAHVQFALVGPAAAQAGRALQMTLEDSTLSVTF